MNDLYNQVWIQKQIGEYACQSETIPLIFEYKDVIGIVHSYELSVKLECGITWTKGNIDNPKSSPTLKLDS